MTLITRTAHPQTDYAHKLRPASITQILRGDIIGTGAVM